MSFRFRKRNKIVPGPPGNLSKGWPSLAIGGHGATLHASRGGLGASPGIPGSGLSWQFGGPRHIHKAIQAQADVKAVHAQGTAKAVEAQAYIIAITNRLETVARRMTRNAPGSTNWKKAAIEQARLLDEMLDVAKEGENDLLISAVRKCHDAWGNDDHHIRAALNSGMTVSECLTNMLSGKQPDENVSAPLSNDETPDANHAFRRPANQSSANGKRPVLGQKQIARGVDEAAIRPAFGETIARNLILLTIGCGVTAAVYTIAVHKPITRPQAIVLAAPTPEATGAKLRPAVPSATFAPETLAATPAATPVISPAVTSAAAPAAEATATPFERLQDIHDKPARTKRSTHNSTRGHGQ
jgi:hypothetical protein